MEQYAAITPSTGDSEKGSKYRSDRRKKSGFNRKPLLPLYSNLPVFNCIPKSGV